MSIMKKNINLGLFLLFIASLICLAAFTLVYQKTYSNLTEQYLDKAGKIENLVDTLGKQAELLRQTSSTLNETTQTKEIITEKYTTLKTGKEQTESDLAFAKKDLADTTTALDTAKASLKTALEELQRKTTELNNRIDDASALTSRINSYKSDYNTLCDSYIAAGGSCTKK